MNNSRAIGHIHRSDDDGFTLVELLIVIVILGVLSTVTVFAVSGITSRGETAASQSDKQILERASEAYNAQEGTYTDEAGLVSAGFLKQESGTWDISLGAGNTSYEIVAPGSGGAPTVEPVVFGSGSWDGEAYGTGTFDIVLIGGPTAQQSWEAYTAANGAPATNARLIFIADPNVDTTTELDALQTETEMIGIEEFTFPDGISGTTTGYGTTNWGTEFDGTQAGTWFNWTVEGGPMTLTSFIEAWNANI